MRVKQESGVTLIELVIALTISAILVGGTYSLFVTQQKTFSVQHQVAALQQDARAALGMMSQEIRMAGFLVGAGSGSGFTDGTNNIAINGCSNAVVPVNSTTAPDAITVVYAAEELGQIQSVSTGVVTLDTNVDSYFKDSGGSLIAARLFVAFEFRPDKLYRVTAVDGTSVTVTNVPALGIPSGTRVYGVRAITYSVNAGILSRNENSGDGAQPLAGDGASTVVEDMQFAYQVRGDSSWYHGGALPAGMANADIRTVRMSLLIRTAIEDSDETGYSRTALEDHVAAAASDGYRRRIYSTVVKIRNLKG